MGPCVEHHYSCRRVERSVTASVDPRLIGRTNHGHTLLLRDWRDRFDRVRGQREYERCARRHRWRNTRRGLFEKLDDVVRDSWRILHDCDGCHAGLRGLEFEVVSDGVPNAVETSSVPAASSPNGLRRVRWRVENLK